MHPGFYSWWKRAHDRAHGCGEGCAAHEHGHGPPPWARQGHGHRHGGCGPGGGPGDARFASEGDDASAGFGVRRPLRFLAHKLELDDAQIEKLAAILNELKTERAQASVDNRRRIGALADSLEGDAFDDAKAASVAAEQAKTEERLQNAITKALGRIHAMLQPEQRKKLAYLLRTGVLSI